MADLSADNLSGVNALLSGAVRQAHQLAADNFICVNVLGDPHVFVDSPKSSIIYLSAAINSTIEHSVSEIHLGDVGVIVDLLLIDGNFPLNAGNWTPSIVFKKPSGNKLTKGAYLVTSGIDGRVKCVLDNGDIDEAGTWQCQPVISANGKLIHGSIETFKVLSNL